uniref:Uncharacterized protein n=1 Tax=Phaselicystis flava TaxID=525924 RepID=A0A3S5GYG1_9BACT|nr:hypothetical protein [Phaselicystis flava]
MDDIEALRRQVEGDVWKWIHEFVATPNEFYNFRFPPCPYARQAVLQEKVDVLVYTSGNVRAFIKAGAIGMRDSEKIGTRVMAFPPKTKLQFGLSDFVESLNADLIKDDVFLNTGYAKTSVSRYPSSPPGEPYFVVIANSLAPVLAGCESLKRTDYYKNWPAEHFGIVVDRRARMARQFGRND